MEQAEKIFSSLEEACNERDITNVEQFIQELEELVKGNEEVNEVYSRAIAKALDTFKGKFSSTKVKKFLSSIETLVEEHPNDKSLKNNYAKILRSSLIAMKTKGQPSAMRDIMVNLDALANNNPDNIAIYEELSDASHEITNYWRTRGDFKALRKRTEKFRKLADKFPDNDKIKLNLSKSLVVEINSSKKSDISQIDKILLEIQELSEATPANIGMQLEWVHAYNTAMERGHENPEDAKRWLDSMKQIAQNKKEEAFKVELAKGYLTVISALGQQNKEELTKHLDELEMLADETKDNLELQTIYAQSLITSLKRIGVSDMTEVNDIVNELKELVEQFPKNKVIMQNYIEALVGIIGIFTQQQKPKEIVPFLEKFEELDEKYPEDQFIQQTYHQLMDTLKMLGFKKKAKKKPRIGYM